MNERLPLLTPDLFASVLPLAIKWAEDGQQFILKHGQPLSIAEQIDAKLAGVHSPEKIRLMYVPEILKPNDVLLQQANDIVQLVTPQTIGLTLQYGIFIRLDCVCDRRLLIHECVHTAQFERLGGIEAFLRKYLDEVNSFGYPQAPMEQEAILTAKRICP